MRKLFFILTLCIFHSAAIAEDLKTYKIVFHDYTKAHGPCWDSAEKLALDFTSLTGIESSGLCISDKKLSYRIEIEYEAEKPLNKIYSNHYLTTPLKYKTKQTCEAELKIQEQNFIEQTGLSPLTFYCSQISGQYYSSQDFEMKFMAFGEPMIKPFFSTIYLYGKILNYSKKTFFDEVAKLYKSQDATISAINLTPSLANANLDILYYSENRLELKQHHSKNIKSRDYCETELQALQNKLTGANLFSYCASVIGMEINFLWLGKENYQFLSSGKTFNNFSYCQNSRDSIIEEFEKKNSLIKAGFCEESGKNKYTVTLIKESK